MSKKITRCPKCGEKTNISAFSNNPDILMCCACNFRGNRGAFEAFIPTVFDRITAAPEVLAKYLVYGDILLPQKEVIFRSRLTVGYWRTAAEAYNETLKILKSSEPPQEWKVAGFGDWDKEVGK